AASHIFSWDFTGAQTVDVVAPGGQAPLTLVVHAPQEAAQRLSDRLTEQAGQDSAVGSVILALAAAQAQPRGPRHRRPGRRRRFNQLRPAAVAYRVLTGSRTVEEPLPVPAAGPQTSAATVDLPAEGFWQTH